MNSSETNQPRQATPVHSAGVALSSSLPTPGSEGDAALPQVNPVARLDGGSVRTGDFIVRITDFDLAVALISAGISLRTDPPYTHSKLKNGQHRWVWNFQNRSSDGKVLTTELVEGYKQGLKFIHDSKNEDTAFVGALCALQNRAFLLEHMRNSKPWIGFRSPGSSAVMLVIEGSKRSQNARAKGMVRCDPFEEQKQHMIR